MKKVLLTEAQFVSLFGKNSIPSNNNFYQDGEFTISNDRMQKVRDIFYPYYEDRYNKDKQAIIHQIAFQETLRMIDNGELQALPPNSGNYYSFRNRRFSNEQVAKVEKEIMPKFENMSLEELYDYLIIDSEKESYNGRMKGKKAIAELLNKGFFDKYLNGQVKSLALWNLGKLENPSEMFGWLYSKNKFTNKLNVQTIEDELNKTRDQIADTDDDFINNQIFLALDTIVSSIWKLGRIPK